MYWEIEKEWYTVIYYLRKAPLICKEMREKRYLGIKCLGLWTPYALIKKKIKFSSI